MKNGVKKLVFGILLIPVISLCACVPLSYQAPPENTRQSTPAVSYPAEPTQSSVISPAPAAPAGTPRKYPEPIYNDDIQAFIDIGLQKRADMEPVLERYYYLYSYPQNQPAFNNPYCVWFERSAAADLDGDGKDENISIIGDTKGNSPGEFYYSIIIDIDGKRLPLTSEDGFREFTLDGVVLDINAEDGKKEIGIPGDTYKGYIITFDDGTPKIIFNDIFDFEQSDITGNGSMEIWRSDFYRELLLLKEDRSGFEKANLKYYTTSYLFYYWDNYKGIGSGGITAWDEKLSKRLGGKKDILLKKGTPVYFGLYSDPEWLMVMDSNGNLLGWLDMTDVTMEEYVPEFYSGDGGWLP